MKTTLTFATAALGFAISMLTAQASATTIGFAAAPASSVANYAGFVFSGGADEYSWIRGSLGGTTPVAALGAAWSNGGTNLSMQLATPGTFTFNSIDLFADASSFGGAPSAATLEGWAGGKLLYTYVTPILDSLSRTAFTTFTLNWAGIDTLKISEDPNENLILTNIRFNEAVTNAVPEPASVAILGIGLAALGVARRKAGKQA